MISGETGAGKTILAHAISLLLGTRADSGLIRPGAPEASVEAVFTLPPGCFADLADEIDIPEGELLAVRRRLSRDGRSRAYIGGRTTTLSVLSELTGRLLAFSAQHEQRRLMLASRQLRILDDYAGLELADLLTEYRLLYDHARELRARLDAINQDSEAQQREAELLGFQVAEIETAGLTAGEDADLEAERKRLLHTQEMREATMMLAEVVTGGGDGIDETGGTRLMDSLSQALSRLENAAGLDAGLDEITARLQRCFYDLEETGRAARDYAESVQSDPARLGEVEERLDLIGQLKRKYGAGGNNSGDEGVNNAGGRATGESYSGAGAGAGVAAILEYAAAASEKLALLTGAAGGRPRLEQELSDLDEELALLAGKLHEMRSDAALRLQDEAGRHLRDLAFNDCGFEVRLTEAPSPTPSGIDSAEFLVRLNPGMPAAPLRDTASGGELSRIMLAIKSAVSTSQETATLVFDEIDAGIGGETGSAVGAKLKSIAAGSQIICITHLPQIACAADANFRVIKRAEHGETMTAVEFLEGEAIVDELCRMMGSRPEDAKARAHASGLLTQRANDRGD